MPEQIPLDKIESTPSSVVSQVEQVGQVIAHVSPNISPPVEMTPLVQTTRETVVIPTEPEEVTQAVDTGADLEERGEEFIKEALSSTRISAATPGADGALNKLSRFTSEHSLSE